MRTLFSPIWLKFGALRETCPVSICRQNIALQTATKTEPRTAEPSAKTAIRKSLETNRTSSIASTYNLSFSIHPLPPTTPGLINSLHMTQRRPNVFNSGRKLQFALSVATRTPTGKTNSVTCRFCEVFGREKSGRVVNKQRKLSTIQSFKPPFRSDNTHSHLMNQHAMKWEQYEKLCTEEKLSFFDVEMPYINTITSHFGVSDERQYQIHAPIIKEVFNRFLSCTNTNSTSNLSQRNDLSTLLTRESDYFCVTHCKQMSLRSGSRECGTLYVVSTTCEVFAGCKECQSTFIPVRFVGG